MTQAAVDPTNTVLRAGFANPLTLPDLKVTDASFIRVYVDGDRLDPSEYSVSNLNSDDGPEITIIDFDTDWYPDAANITASFEPPLSQPSDLSAGGVFGLAFENAIDAIVRLLLSIRGGLDRTLKVPFGITGDIVLPTPTPGAMVAWNEAGDGFVNGPRASEVSSLTGVEAARALVYPASGPEIYDAVDRRIANLGDAEDPADAVNLQTLNARMVATRTAMKALDAPEAVLTERGRAGVWERALLSSLSSDDQAKAASDTAEGVFALSSPYVWVRKLGVPCSVQRYGMHPDATASENVAALTAALAREAFLVIPAEVDSLGVAKPYLMNAQVTSARDGQIIEGEGFNSLLKASATISSAALLKCITNRHQEIRSLMVDGDSKASYGIHLDFPKCNVLGCYVTGAVTAGVLMSHFSQFVGDGCFIRENDSIGILAQDGTGQVNDMHIGGGRQSYVQGNGAHGIRINTANRDGFWLQNINLENNNTLLGGYADVSVPVAIRGLHIRDMYHETDLNDALYRCYKFASSIQGVSMDGVKMNASSPTTPPEYLIDIAYTGGTIAQAYRLTNLWGDGYSGHMINNSATSGGVNDIAVGSVVLGSTGGGSTSQVAQSMTAVRDI